jgi:hypothetical protein
MQLSVETMQSRVTQMHADEKEKAMTPLVWANFPVALILFWPGDRGGDADHVAGVIG